MDSAGETALRALDALKRTGLEKSECSVRLTRTDELNLDSGEISLLRTTENVSITLTGIVENREGSLTLNRMEPSSIDDAASRVLDMAVSSEPDAANDISPVQPRNSFEKGPAEPDLDMMYERMKSFLDRSNTMYPSLILEQAILDFTAVEKSYMNSNGVDLSSRRGFYSFFPMFTSKEGRDTSSFNYSSVTMASLDRQLHECGTIDTLMAQSTEQVRAGSFEGKFTGDLIIAPDCMEDFIQMVCYYLTDYPMVKGTSIFKESLGTRMAGSGLTLRCAPVSDEIANGYFITGDGFVAGNTTVIEQGMLASFLLSLYGSNKTGTARSLSGPGAFIVDAGESGREEMVSSVDRGILLCRFSGGMPSESGDFSGVAKNSYLIEGGEIRRPVSEVMISGNLRELLENIGGISRERVNFGHCIMPWLKAGGVTVSGKG